MIFCLIFNVLSAQNEFKSSFDSFAINDRELGIVEFCTFNSSIDKEKPIFLYIHGSGNIPTFSFIKETGKYSWAGFQEVSKYKDDYHVIFVNKPGVPLFDTLQLDSVTSEFSYPKNREFIENFSLDWRVKAASLVIEKAIDLLPIDTSKIIVVGHSQGGQVAPKVAVVNKKVTHVAVLNCGSLSHFYDYILQERLEAFRGNHTFEQSQGNIDWYFESYKDIFSDPNNTSKTWKTETYLKWSSFNKETVLESMLKLDIPIYLVGSGKDLYNSAIMSTDYAMIEFLRLGKTNLTYKVYPNANHFLQREVMEGETLKKVYIADSVFENIINWTDK